MTNWKKTSCVLCALNCGLEVLTDGSKIIRVRGDRENPRSRGYLCRKGSNTAYFQNNPQRLKYPLKKVGDHFERISWNSALDEIAGRIKEIHQNYGPRSFAYVGGGGQGCHFQANFGIPFFIAGLGCRNYYNALGQELTGVYWADGKVYGRQTLHAIEDIDNADFVVFWGHNPMMSHQFPRAPLVIRDKKKEPGFLLAVVDPRDTETAKLADIHLKIRPGTDALLFKAMIKILWDEDLIAKDYVQKNIHGFEAIRPWFGDVNIEENCRVCNLDPEEVRRFTRFFSTRRTVLRSDLGVEMGRHSTLLSYLEKILLALTGRVGVKGGNVFPGSLATLGVHTPEEDRGTWKTAVTHIPQIMGIFPPNVLPEEIDNDHPQRIRAVMLGNCNPLISYADTAAYERAFAKLDLLVTVEIVMTETAALSHYVLPSKSPYEKWDGNFFAKDYPEYFFQMRPPVAESEGEAVEESEIYIGLAERMGLIPKFPARLRDVAGNRGTYQAAFREYLKDNPRAAPWSSFILAQTLGKELGSNHLAVLWDLVHQFVAREPEDVRRAGYPLGATTAEDIFQKIIHTPSGVKIGRVDTENNLRRLETSDKKIHIHIPEMESWLKEVQPAWEEALLVNKEYPLLLKAGSHMDMVANSNMRDPAWNKGRRACTMRIHSADAREIGIQDGEMAVVETEAGSARIEAEVTDTSHRGQVVIPHGFGMIHMEEVYGINVNRLTSAKNRDRLAATPLHQYIPCRVRRA